MATLTTNKLQEEAGRSVSPLPGACRREKAPAGTFLDEAPRPPPKVTLRSRKSVGGGGGFSSRMFSRGRGRGTPLVVVEG